MAPALCSHIHHDTRITLQARPNPQPNTEAGIGKAFSQPLEKTFWFLERHKSYIGFKLLLEVCFYFFFAPKLVDKTEIFRLQSGIELAGREGANSHLLG